MKTKIQFAWLGAAVLALWLAPAAGYANTNDLSAALSQGLFEEEANHNLGAAIQAYQSVIDRFDADRKLAATAVFRLGECYRKQGHTNEASAQFERVVREFADQPPLLALSRQYLASMGNSPAAPGPAGQSTPALNAAESPLNVVDVGELSRVEAIVKNSPDLINAPDKTGQTLLQTYAGKGDLDVVKLLLDHGAVPDGIKQQDLTPLHFAAGNGHKAVVEFLLSKGAKADSKNESGVTPLHLAVARGYEQVAKVLIDAGASVNARVQKNTSRPSDSLYYNLQANQTPVHLACARGFPGLVKLLISKGADVNASDAQGSTPLTVAVQVNNDEMIKELLAAGAGPNVGQPSALTFAAGQGNVPILELLLSHGANTNLTAALQRAVVTPYPAAVTKLIEFKADPNAKDGQGEPLVFTALNAPETLKALLEGGADPNTRGSAGSLLLERAIRDHPQSVDTLLTHGADPNAITGEGNTPLHVAVLVNNTAAAKALLEHGAKVNTPGKGGYTPLHLAVANKELVALLLEHGADPNLRSESGETPLDIATRLSGAPQSLGAAPPQFNPPPPRLPGSPQSVAVSELLLQHGARKDLPRMDCIEVRRGPSYVSAVLFRGTNDLNRFSLLELLAVHYGFVSALPYSDSFAKPHHYSPGHVATVQGSLPFPSLANLEIRRPKPDGKGWNPIPVSAQAILDSGDCSRDVWLQWGDQVEIPEADHPLGEQWNGFPRSTAITNLLNCLTRQIRVAVKGHTSMMTLEYHKGGPDDFPPSFCLAPALQNSGLLRASSDLSRVKVIRHNAETGENWERTFDCSGATPYPFLWLRNGDAIEVPDKDLP